MKKGPVNIDQLFQKAATTPVHTSFDEAKETFAQSLTQRGKGGNNFFRSLKWIFMTTLILGGITAITIALYPNSKPTELQKKQPITHHETVLPKTEAEVPHSSEQTEVPELEPMDFEAELLALPIPVIQHYLREPQKLLSEPNYLYYSFANDFRNEKDSIEIPQLSEKEIAANNKRKRKMMKALAKRDKNYYAYIPSGSTKYKEKIYSVQAFFMQKREVSNLEYRTFLNDLVIQGRIEEYKQAFPQTAQWSAQIDGDVSDLQNLYHWHPAFNNYPVVNVTREGAEMYCAWLTLETSNSKYIDNNAMINDLRIPMRDEWTYAASGGDTNAVYPWGGPSTQNAEACFLANYKPDSTSYFADGAFFTAAVESYNPSDFGMYCMSGNVAEMVYGSTDITSHTNLTKLRNEVGTAGGGWMDDENALKIEGDDPYEGIEHGHPNIGFRPVMTFLGKGHLAGVRGN